MKKWLPVTALAGWLLLISCVPAVPQETAQSDPVQPYVDANRSRATAQAAAETAEYYSGLLTATVQAQQATATERAWVVQQTQVAAQITATARAWEATVAADSAQSTATAAATQTMQALMVQATAQAVQATSTANAANGQAYATAMAGEAERVRQAVERDRQTNTLKALAPWIGLALVFPLSLWLLYQRGRLVTIPRDARGDAPLMLDVVEGVVTDVDRSLHPQSGMRRADLASLPKPPLALQAGVTERDQMLDLATRPGGDERRKETARQIAAQNAALPQGETGGVTIVPPQSVQPRLGDVIAPMMLEAVDGEIKEEE
ncbi:MAG: hypothetical protein ACOYYI_01655 [Chloroflexota bacterium]